MTRSSVARLVCRTTVYSVSEQVDRRAAEDFITDVFSRHYHAKLSGFMPELMTLTHNGQIQSAVGTRSAGDGAHESPLFLECYLDEPIETAIRRITSRPVARQAIVEVGQLAADRPGAGTALMLHLGKSLAANGFQWMVFTATEELRGIFIRLGLPLFALASANPHRLGKEAQAWGSYYQHHPLVVCASLGDAMRRMRHLR
ncbi:MAG: thermostable hemolysin [Rhodocyclaceae bacterium]|nr:thermostable hemolysin [Rhodocyclaceae bacterium]